MILAMLLMLQQAAPPPEIPSEEEILVIGKRRFIDVDFAVRYNRLGWMTLKECRVIRPSGHAELDAIPCEMAQQCVRDQPLTRRRLRQCIERRSNKRVDEVIAAWRAAR